ncbi:MAG: 16S rRNA (cytosine(967)-C(5))-methyltransferase RsmB [Oligoflexales bacterium]|nr:16S rRNA (cytosine(967)-C(5))-methyltransferase RsmB [Oligoflexales bacterium]
MSSPLSVSRRIALDAFVEVMEKHSTPEEATEKLYNKFSNISRQDKNFVKELLYGSLRWYGKLYWILQHTAKRDLSKSSPEIRAALVLGAYQIYYMSKVPDRAAVNESVEFIRNSGQAAACSFVNGILRQISRRAEYFAKPDKEKRPAEYLSVQFSYPQWMVERWLKQFRFDQLVTMLPLNNSIPPNTIRINGLKVSQEAQADLLKDLLRLEKNHIEKRPLRNCFQLSSSPDFSEESLFSKGLFTVQDESAQLIAHLVNPQNGENIVDICAGPGGKLGHLYELSEGKANLTAVEINPAQIVRLKESMARLGHSRFEVFESNLFDWKPAVPQDKVLLDAPCSGFGVLRRHPEGKWLKTEKLVTEMQAKQREMLKHCVSLLKKSGELIYSVCSHEIEETAQQLNWLMQTFPNELEVISAASRLPPYYKQFVTRQNILLVYSGNSEGMDGFGAFIVKRV